MDRYGMTRSLPGATQVYLIKTAANEASTMPLAKSFAIHFASPEDKRFKIFCANELCGRMSTFQYLGVSTPLWISCVFVDNCQFSSE
jgi:hypothetical protein